MATASTDSITKAKRHGPAMTRIAKYEYATSIHTATDIGTHTMNDCGAVSYAPTAIVLMSLRHGREYRI